MHSLESSLETLYDSGDFREHHDTMIHLGLLGTLGTPGTSWRLWDCRGILGTLGTLTWYIREHRGYFVTLGDTRYIRNTWRY
jgi:hypothetical protein